MPHLNASEVSESIHPEQDLFHRHLESDVMAQTAGSRRDGRSVGPRRRSVRNVNR